MSLHSPPRFIAALVAAAIAVSGFGPGAHAQTAPKVTGTAGCIVKGTISAGEAAQCGNPTSDNLNYGNWTTATEVNNALSNLQNQIIDLAWENLNYAA
jgi:hypothetical protein